MAIKIIYLEQSKYDREYVHPFNRTVEYNDTIKFIAVDDVFIVSISNKDNFLKNTDNSDADDNLVFTLDSEGTQGPSTKEYKIAPAADVPYKYYNVCWNGIYADRPGNSPPRIIIAP
jgi:hypothetical protein